jgi:hypothetical protein
MRMPSKLPLAASLTLFSALATGCTNPHKEQAPPAPADQPSPDDTLNEDDSAPTDSETDCRTKAVDLLFVIDNSGSMSEEQAKLARTVPKLLGILATGNHSGKRSVAGEPTDFVPADTIHVGVISTDLAVNLAPSPNSCGDRSFVLNSDPRTSTQRLNKPFGDDGELLSSTEVALAGISIASPDFMSLVEAVPPDPTCADVQLEEPYLSYAPGARFEDTGHAFSCISKLGRTGCGLEQQLEAMLKALTPADSHRFTFSRGTRGQGSAPGTNAGFLRDDAVLAVVHISDEEDCSIPDASSSLFDLNATIYEGGINVRCGLPSNQQYLQPISRYAEGLRALKPARYRDRVIFAGIVGVPTADDSGSAVHSGAMNIAALLERPDMQYLTRPNAPHTDDESVPTCESAQGDGTAAPGRRFLEVAAAFGDNGLVTSICDDSYQTLVSRISDRISKHLGSCD